MDEERTLLLGIDLCNDYTQVCLVNRQSGQPDSVAFGDDKGKLRIPTALVLRRNTREWMIGEDAVSFANDNRRDPDVHIVKDILVSSRSGNIIPVFDTAYSTASLLEKFFKRILTIVRQKNHDENIRGLVVTVQELNDRLRSDIKSALGQLGILEDRLKIQDHLESFMYYTVYQTADIWINDVALFDYGEGGLKFYRLSFGRKMLPVVITASKEDFSDVMSVRELSERRPDELAHTFDEVSGRLLHRQIVSALFVTGVGFEDDWSSEVLKKLCAGRRVFRGQNLYSKGAGYSAMQYFGDKKGDFVLISDEMLLNDISIRVFSDGEYKEVMLAKAGELWREIDASVCVIMDGTDEIDLVVKNVCRRDPICAIISLGAIGDVSKKDKRLRVSMRFLDRDTAVITVRDDGFGELRRSTGRIWEQILKL